MVNADIEAPALSEENDATISNVLLNSQCGATVTFVARAVSRLNLLASTALKNRRT